MTEPQHVPAGLELAHIAKRFGATTIIDDLSLQVEQGEFIVFLGPSGCGKSTLLRMVAGLETPDSGEIRVHGERVDHLPPGARSVAMVFQHYALYPHMNVRENLAFGLRNARVARDEIAQRIDRAARMLEIDALLDRRPGQLSGGQRQRVAVGRAIVKQPRLFLFDEPLSNLDAGLRTRMRLEIAQLQQRVRATMIFVTHDQVEAMTLADRIVVLNGGRIEQIGTPAEIYARPATIFVASAIGSPPINLIDPRLVGGGRLAPPGEDGLRLGVRAEAVRVASRPGDLSGVAQVLERLGDRTLIHLALADGTMIVAQDIGSSGVSAGDTVALDIDDRSVHLFDRDGRRRHAAL